MLSPALRAHLIDPPKRYRPIPFWSWNERLQEAETRRQIAAMDRAGIGGYFMHARGGLETEYMGPEWMANIAAGIDEARARGMGAWAYDENGWPSGFGDGRVNGRGLAFQQKYLRLAETIAELPRDDGHTIGFMRADGRLFHAWYEVNPFYVDTLDAAVVQVFLEEIYAPYHQRYQADFGAAMPGFFTDEPQISRNGIPWSFVLPDRYRQAYGEDLLPLLPQLFRPTGSWQRTRYRFWQLVQELFVTAFSEQLYDWCAAHGCRLTGHMVLEETLLSQLTSNAAVMPHYEFFHVPGMDWLGRHIDPPTTPLQVASVAHQLGRRQVLSETFALTGWNVSFQELRWMLEWQMVRGVTLLCQHLEGYSLRGIRKRDYPPSLFFQQPWWDDYRLFNDAMARLGVLLTEGEADFEVLVLHPQASAWLCFDAGTNAGLDELDAQFQALTRALEEAQIPFHYGDERILRRHGRVARGLLRVGQRQYSEVVVPPCQTVSRRTWQLLTEFAAAGGRLYWCAPQPTRIDGMEDDGLAALRRCGVPQDSVDAVPAALPAAVRGIQVRAAADGAPLPAITATTRSLPAADADAGQTRLYYFVNRSLEQPQDTVITVPGAAAARLDVETGTMAAVVYQQVADGVSLRHRFAGGDSLALLVSDRAGAGAPAVPGPACTPLAPEELQGDWELELLEPNALTLDVCDAWFDGELVGRGLHVGTVQSRALALERAVDVRLVFAIDTVAGYAPPADCRLVMECPERYAIQVNGQLLAPRDLGHYRDTSFRQLDLAGTLRNGHNQIELRIRFTQSAAVYANLRRARAFEAEKNKLTFDTEIEALYLIGAFGVATPGTWTDLPRDARRYVGPFALAPLPRTVTQDDLTPQGLPFFNGRLRLRRTVPLQPAALTARSFQYVRQRAHVVSLAINGQPLRTWLWGPYQMDLPDGVLRAGDNDIALELTCGLRNLLGPHHLEEGESYAVAPSSFFQEPNIWGHRPWHAGYCFVRQGIAFAGDGDAVAEVGAAGA